MKNLLFYDQQKYLMLVQDFINSTIEKKYYIKKKLIKDQALIYNGSIFPSHRHQSKLSTPKDQYSKHQTITTNIQRTMTVQSNYDPPHQLYDRSPSVQQRKQMLPRIYVTSQTKYSKKSLVPKQVPSFKIQAREKILNHHVSDPLYLKLQKTMKKRANNNFNRYKQGWIKSCMRRKGKNLLENSLQKSMKNIENKHLDTQKRRTKIEFTQMLRNNHEQKKFIYPARIRPQIEGLKGRGGSMTPIHLKPFIIEQVYKHHRSVTNRTE